MLGRVAAIACSTFLGAALVLSHSSRAQPAPGGDEIEIGDSGSGSGSGSGSATPAVKPVVQKDPKAAKKLVAAGQAASAKADGLAKRGKADDAKAQYEVAVTALQQATELGDDINVYFYLAGVEDKLGRFVESVRHYRLVLRAASGVDPKIAKQISAKLDEVMGKVGTVQLTVVPDGTTVSLLGEALGVTPLPEPLVLLPGTYTFELTAPGFDPKSTDIAVEAGSESERKIELESIKVIIEKPHKIGPDEVDKVTVKKPTIIPALVGGGVAVALVGTAIVTGVLARHNHATFIAPDTKPVDRLDAQDAGKSYAHLTDALFGGAIAAAGFGAYWYVFQYRNKLHAHAETETSGSKMSKVDVMPWVESQSSGLTVFGRF